MLSAQLEREKNSEILLFEWILSVTLSFHLSLSIGFIFPFLSLFLCFSISVSVYPVSLPLSYVYTFGVLCQSLLFLFVIMSVHISLLFLLYIWLANFSGNYLWVFIYLPFTLCPFSMFLFCSFSLCLIFNLKIWKWWTYQWLLDVCNNIKLICTKIHILQSSMP